MMPCGTDYMQVVGSSVTLYQLNVLTCCILYNDAVTLASDLSWVDRRCLTAL